MCKYDTDLLGHSSHLEAVLSSCFKCKISSASLTSLEGAESVLVINAHLASSNILIYMEESLDDTFPPLIGQQSLWM